VAGHSGQFTPGGYLSTVIHTTLEGIEPATFRLLVRRTTSMGYRDHQGYQQLTVTASSGGLSVL